MPISARGESLAEGRATIGGRGRRNGLLAGHCACYMGSQFSRRWMAPPKVWDSNPLRHSCELSHPALQPRGQIGTARRQPPRGNLISSRAFASKVKATGSSPHSGGYAANLLGLLNFERVRGKLEI